MKLFVVSRLSQTEQSFSAFELLLPVLQVYAVDIIFSCGPMWTRHRFAWHRASWSSRKAMRMQLGQFLKLLAVGQPG